MLDVRKLCNLTSVAYKLPSEILLFIFDLVQHDTAREAGHATVELSASPNSSLVSLTHVCHRWRAVALGCPALWTGVLSRSSSAETFVERACDMPLSVVAEVVGGRLSKPTKRLLWRLRARIQCLHIVVEFLPQLLTFRKMLGRLSSNLLSLAIVVRRSRRMHPDRLEHLFPLFGGRAPCLRSLSISSPDPLMPTDHFLALAGLHLSNSDHTQILNELSQLLRRTPNLETVHLHLRLQDAVSLVPFNTRTPIALPRLRRFCVTSLPRLFYQPPRRADLYSILAHIVFPPDAVVTIQEEASYSLSSGVHHLYMPPVGPHPRSIVTVDDSGTVVTTRGSSTFTIAYQERITAAAIMSPFGLWTNDNPFVGSEHLLSTVTILLLQGALSWRWPVKNNLTALSRLAACMPLLTELVVRDFATEMLPQLTRLLDHAGTTTLCPLLTSITFITLGSAVSLPDAQEPQPILEILLRATMRRAERGCPLARFTFCSPYVEQEHTLHNAYGVEQVSVLRRDVWSECSEGVDQDAAAHWADVKRSFPQQKLGRTRGYEALWKRHVEGDPPARVFGACGHKHQWP